MHWDALIANAWHTVREFIFYSARLHVRSARDTWEYISKHYMSWEATLAMAAGVWLAVTGPWFGVAQRFLGGFLSGLGILGLAVTLHYLARLIVAPYLQYSEIENELALHAPRPRASPPRGLIDFEVDISENRSSDRLMRIIQALGQEAERATREVEKRQSQIQPTSPPRARLRAAKYFARILMGSARRIRRLHDKLVAATQQFEETWVGYTPHSYAQASPDQRLLVREAMIGARKSAASYRDTIAATRQTFDGLRILQQDLAVAVGVIEIVYANLEKTLDKNVQVYTRIMAAIDAGQRALDENPVSRTGMAKGQKRKRKR